MCRAEICDEDFLSRNTRRLRRPRRDRLDTSDSRDGPATSNCFPKLQSFSVSESETRRRSPSRSPRHKNRPRQAVKSPNPGFWWAKCAAGVYSKTKYAKAKCNNYIYEACWEDHTAKLHNLSRRGRRSLSSKTQLSAC